MDFDIFYDDDRKSFSKNSRDLSGGENDRVAIEFFLSLNQFCSFPLLMMDEDTSSLVPVTKQV